MIQRDEQVNNDLYFRSPQSRLYNSPTIGRTRQLTIPTTKTYLVTAATVESYLFSSPSRVPRGPLPLEIGASSEETRPCPKINRPFIWAGEVRRRGVANADAFEAVTTEPATSGESKAVAVSPEESRQSQGCCSSARGDEFPRLIGSTAGASGRRARAHVEHRQSTVAFIPARNVIVLGVDQQGDVAESCATGILRSAASSGAPRPRPCTVRSKARRPRRNIGTS